MAYIKKLKYNELVGGTDNTDVYPVTSTEAVYGPDNINQQVVNEDRLRRIELLEKNVQSLDGLKEMVEALISGDYDYQEGLSDNNFTDELKAKLEGLENYNDAELRQLLADIDTAKANAEDVYTKSEIDDKLGDIQGALTFDNTPIAGSDNPVKSSGIYTALQGKQDTISDLATIRSGAEDGATAVQPDEMTAALAGKQNVIEDLSTIRSGAAAGATAYQKPSGGIPKSDLATAVQTSLNKADSALQSYTESDPVFTASPAHGITSADITAWNGKADKVAIVNHGTSDTTFTLTPNIFHVWGTVTSLTLTLATASTTTMDEFMFQFTSGTNATTLSLPSAVKWIVEPEIEAGMTYQVSIVNNIAVIGGVS